MIKTQDSQSSQIINYLTTKPKGYTFTTRGLIAELTPVIPKLSSGAVTGLVFKMWKKDILSRNFNNGLKTFMYTIISDPTEYNAKEKAGVGSFKGRVINNVTIRKLSNNELENSIGSVISILSNLDSSGIDLSGVPSEDIIGELMRRERTKHI